MRYISMFSGIEAASVAFGPLGWEALRFAEVDAFPSAVLAHHYPDVPNVGDMTAHDWSQYRGQCDLVVGGPPCQAFSVAGLRQSLDDQRGNLSLAYVQAIRAIDPLWSLTENVPGWLSTADNAFGCVLGGLVGADAALVSPLERGRWPDAGVVSGPERTAAWRIIDAQYLGLAQRRRRVFVLSVRGARNWACASALLPVGESLSGHPAPRREAGQVAPTVPARRTAGGGLGTDFDCDGGLISADIANALETTYHDYSRADGFNMIAHSLRAEGFDASEEGTGRGTPLVVAAEGDIASPQRCGGNDHADYQNIVGVAHAFDARQSDVIQYGDQAGPLDTDGHSIAVAFQSSQLGIREVKTHATLDANNGSRRHNGVVQHMAVRRLTPRECERLMGFSDDYTLIPYRGKLAADGPRYKSLGNSMAVPCMSWLGRRIQMVEEIAEAVA